MLLGSYSSGGSSNNIDGWRASDSALYNIVGSLLVKDFSGASFTSYSIIGCLFNIASMTSEVEFMQSLMTQYYPDFLAYLKDVTNLNASFTTFSLWVKANYKDFGKNATTSLFNEVVNVENALDRILRAVQDIDTSGGGSAQVDLSPYLDFTLPDGTVTSVADMLNSISTLADSILSALTNGDDSDESAANPVPLLRRILSSVNSGFFDVKDFLYDLNNSLCDDNYITAVEWLAMLYDKEFAVEVPEIDLSGLTVSVDTSGIESKLDDIYKQLVLSNIIAAGDLAHDFLSDFLSAAASAVGGVADSIKDVFPFCLVFVAMGVLDLFATNPVAPAFSVGVPTGIGQTTMLEIDLSQYDDMAAVCRGLVLGLYIVGLLAVTKNYMYNGDGS